jgi:hypothetical protein
MDIRAKASRKLLVEGSDDQHVILALCSRHKLPVTFDVVDNRGVTNLLKSISVWLKTSSLETLGMILDADEQIEKRWHEVKGRLEQAGYHLPSHSVRGGTILRQPGLPVVGIWLMPDNVSSGMLEDFLKYLIPEGDLLLPEAERTLDKLEMERINGYKHVHRAKSLLHTWLAWQDSPGMPIGVAITHSYLDTNSDLGYEFVEWLRELFG